MNPENHENYERLIRQARQTNLVEWLQKNDVALKKVGQWYEIEGYDSLRIQNNMWYRNSQDKGGNAIDFLCDFYGYSPKEAIIALTGINLTGRGKIIPKLTPNGVKEKNKELTLFGKAPEDFNFDNIRLNKNQRRVIAYLIQNRGISADIVLKEIKNRNLFQEADTGNAIFAIKDEKGVIVGAEAIGTLSYENARFKAIKEGSKYGYGYNIGKKHEPHYILFFESAIDLLSFITIEQKHTKILNDYLLVSMMGLKAGIVEKMIKSFGESTQPIFCVDNDEAGNNFIMQNLLIYPNAQVWQPDKDYKDWNDQLLDKKSRI